MILVLWTSYAAGHTYIRVRPSAITLLHLAGTFTNQNVLQTLLIQQTPYTAEALVNLLSCCCQTFTSYYCD